MSIRCTFFVHILLSTLSTAAPAQVVEIPDPDLRDAIREALNLPASVPITRAAMRQLVEPYAGDRQIKDLTGLEHALELKVLHLGGNEIEELQPLASLVNLEELYLFVNPISNLFPLAHLTELRTLDLGGCHQISDIASLVDLTQLVSLRLHYNQIEDLGPLANLTNLTELHLHNNRIMDVSPLANLTRLESLEIHNNPIMDYSLLDGPSFTHFTFDEGCELPSLPIEDRIQYRNYPSVFYAWNSILNLPELSDLKRRALHDLYWSSKFGLDFRQTKQGIKVFGNLERAHQERDGFLALNPNMIFLVEIRMRDAPPQDFPEDSPYWVRDAQGSVVGGWGDQGLIDFTHPGLQDLIVQQAIAVAECGLYDGVFFDWSTENSIVLKGNRSFEAEQQARDEILQRIRAEVSPDFLIMVNNKRRKLSRTARYINGTFMETLVPRDHDEEEIQRRLREIESTLLWAEENLREPQINGLEGWSVLNEPPDSQTNLRWMRAFTTLSLTHSDGYVLFSDSLRNHGHYWYDFWDADLGRPVGPKATLYDEDIPGLYIREYTNGWAVYNHSGEAQVITLPEEAQGVASGLVNTEHALPNLDGEMYLRVKPKNPADVNGDGVVNILDLTLVAQGFGTDSLEADVNGDGVVNVFDLVLVANQF